MSTEDRLVNIRPLGKLDLVRVQELFVLGVSSDKFSQSLLSAFSLRVVFGVCGERRYEASLGVLRRAAVTERVNRVVVSQLVPTTHEVAGRRQFWAKLDRADSHIEDQSLLCQRDLATVVFKIECLLRFLFVLGNFLIRLGFNDDLSWHKTTKDQDLGACNLSGASQNNLETGGIRDVVDDLPRFLVDLVNLHLIDEIKRLFSSDHGFWLKTLASEHEDVALVEVTDRALLAPVREWLKSLPLIV